MTRVILVMEQCSGDRSIREFTYETDEYLLEYELTKFVQDLTGDNEIAVSINIPEFEPKKRKGKKA